MASAMIQIFTKFYVHTLNISWEDCGRESCASGNVSWKKWVLNDEQLSAKQKKKTGKGYLRGKC